MDSVFIISPLVGSLIGYWTNWLAIKMLFRPLTKKEIFGFEIPFTPGVIPRRRTELAESIGGAVGKKLLTPDAFEKILQGPNMKTKVQEFIKEKIKNLENENRNLEEILTEIFSDDKEVETLKELLKKVINENIEESLSSDQVTELIKSQFNSEQTIKKINSYLNSREYYELKTEIIALIQEESMVEGLQEQVVTYLKAELNNIEEDKTVREIIPDSLIQSGKAWLEEQKPEVINHLISFLESEELKQQIESKVENFFDNNPMLSMLSGFKDKIVEKFLNYLISYVEEEENQVQIMQEIDRLLDSLLDTSCVSIIERLDEEDLEQIAKKIVDQLVKEENINQLFDKFENKIIEKLKSEQGNNFLEVIVDKIVHNNLIRMVIADIVDFKVEELFVTPLSNYFEKLDKDLIQRLENGIVNVIEYIMEHHLGTIFATLDFEKLVKDKINSFDVLEVERLLLDVIETELNAITWFGAVLGFLLGLITPIISLL
ncbi:DUF445 family protein [Halanaerobacter jeridensis]|uniref:Uncharacterized membrane protein YheB (UPF0754 family) n=1 Tax=Halanaerobacter jeridensis TaxID=706427 RepID=A0A938XSF9_9FIRM|nr:uncharacterized membrane protein YheB (UPF0754 family) [Halanaerobacter jeridensis]